jgi:hypothetical protein
MVFYYKIRGGRCKGASSHIDLRSEDIVCYVGRDKFENEHLIKYGWPGDVWFHVDDLSSAHVYFRLNYDIASKHHGTNVIPLNGSIPIDDLPDDAIYDMMQIVKYNSIAGSKLASCKIVWTPHANLKKNFDMAAGAVTYHDTKDCRYGRCHKDRPRVKELEKTKSVDHVDVDYYAENKANELSLIERRKKHRKMGGGAGGDLYDPIEADRLSSQLKGTRQGDEQSGLDQGMAALEDLALGSGGGGGGHVTSKDGSTQQSSPQHGNGEEDKADIPQWKRDINEWEKTGNSEKAIFLLERGYPKADVDQVLSQHPNATNIKLLQKLWQGLNNGNESAAAASSDDGAPDPDELQAAREEEREVLEAIFGEDLEWLSEEGLLDAAVPISNYEPPERYFSGGTPPPELRVEIYANDTKYPFANDPPTLALTGGGFPQEYLYKMTQQLQQETYQKAQEEEPGDPQLFALITWIGDIWEGIVEEEEKAAAKAVEEARKARLKALREKEKKERESAPALATPSAPGIPKFSSERERRDYALKIATQSGAAAAGADPTATEKGKKYYKTGVSNDKLIADMFS